MEGTFFNEQEKGYDKQQVDSYILRIIQEYRMVYQKYLKLNEEYRRLSKSCKNKEIKNNKYK